MEIVKDFVEIFLQNYNNNGKPWQSSMIFACEDTKPQNSSEISYFLHFLIVSCFLCVSIFHVFINFENG